MKTGFACMLLVAAFLAGCSQQGTKSDSWREDFSVQRLSWERVSGSENMRLKSGIWIVNVETPCEEIIVVDDEWQHNKYVLKTTVQLSEKGEAGLILGFKDEDNFWRITLEHAQNRIALWQRANGVDKLITDGSITLKHREYHNITVTIDDVLLTVECNGLIVFETGKPDDLDGRLGLIARLLDKRYLKIYATFDLFEAIPQ